jgi:hypothetical protein
MNARIAVPAVFAALAAVLCPAALEAAAAGSPAGTISVTFLSTPIVRVGQEAVIPIRVANGSSGKAVGVSLDVTAPTWVRLSGPRCAPRSSGVRCALRDLAGGTGVTVRIRATPSRRQEYLLVARASFEDVSAGRGVSTRSLSVTAPFRGLVSPISADVARRMTGVSWRPGCPVALSDLRVLTVSFWGFDARAQDGTLIVHRSVAAAVVRVMRRLYAIRFPIRRMVPVDVYGGDDFRSIEADNTSAFNCRAATGSSHWSEHAYGRAIDLDPLENPYVSGGRTSHPASRRYLDRSLRLPGMIHAGDAVVRAFAAVGWGWGGAWSGIRDYQHFSASGR